MEKFSQGDKWGKRDLEKQLGKEADSGAIWAHCPMLTTYYKAQTWQKQKPRENIVPHGDPKGTRAWMTDSEF